MSVFMYSWLVRFEVLWFINVLAHSVLLAATVPFRILVFA